MSELIDKAFQHVAKQSILSIKELDSIKDSLVNYMNINNLVLVDKKNTNYERRICYWTSVDIIHVLDNLDIEIDYTDEDIDNILDLIEDKWDANYGLSWWHVEYYVNEYFNIEDKYTDI